MTMIFEKFVTETKAIWVHYLTYINTMRIGGHVDSEGGSILFPNILLATNCSGFYIIELVGATSVFNGLTVKKHKEKSIDRYFNQFDDSEPDYLFHLNGRDYMFQGMCFAQDADFIALENRFPSIELYGAKLNNSGGRGSVFYFGKDFESCSIENCILVNRLDNLFRCKNILAAYVFKSSITKPKLVEFFKKILQENEVHGVRSVLGKYEERLIVVGQLQNLYLKPSLHETTIGEFLKLHPDVIKSAFKTEHFEYEPYLEWLEHDGTCEDVAINPDLLIRRNDGYYDIYDLKTAGLAKKI